jgi:hypothetical protein
MRKPAQVFVASVLAGFTLVCLSASAAAQKPNDWPAAKSVTSASAAVAV